MILTTEVSTAGFWEDSAMGANSVVTGRHQVGGTGKVGCEESRQGTEGLKEVGKGQRHELLIQNPNTSLNSLKQECMAQPSRPQFLAL